MFERFVAQVCRYEIPVGRIDNNSPRSSFSLQLQAGVRHHCAISWRSFSVEYNAHHACARETQNGQNPGERGHETVRRAEDALLEEEDES